MTRKNTGLTFRYVELFTKTVEDKKVAYQEGKEAGHAAGRLVGLEQGKVTYLKSAEFACYKKMLKTYYIDEVNTFIERECPDFDTSFLEPETKRPSRAMRRGVSKLPRRLPLS